MPLRVTLRVTLHSFGELKVPTLHTVPSKKAKKGRSDSGSYSTEDGYEAPVVLHRRRWEEEEGVGGALKRSWLRQRLHRTSVATYTHCCHIEPASNDYFAKTASTMRTALRT